MGAATSPGGQGNQIRKARYQITRNVFVNCYLNILEASGLEVKALIGINSRSDAQVPIGTRIILNPEANTASGSEFATFSMIVLKTEEHFGKLVHICSPIHRQTTPNQRKVERKPVSFPVLLTDSQTIFFAVNGSHQGLELACSAQKAMLKLTINQTYTFKVNCKGEDCQLQGQVKHIQYDRKTFQHRVGIHFPDLGKDELIILNLLVDPDYKVPLSQNQTVDTTTGKISLND